jgi:hypothetical protein
MPPMVTPVSGLQRGNFFFPAQPCYSIKDRSSANQLPEGFGFPAAAVNREAISSNLPAWSIHVSKSARRPTPPSALSSISERIAKLEVQDAGSRIVGRVDVVVSVLRLAEQVVDGDIAGAVRNQEEVRVVEDVQRLDAELD